MARPPLKGPNATEPWGISGGTLSEGIFSGPRGRGEARPPAIPEEPMADTINAVLAPVGEATASPTNEVGVRVLLDHQVWFLGGLARNRGDVLIESPMGSGK